MHKKLHISFVLVIVFMMLVITTSISINALGYNRRIRMNYDVTNAFHRARWSFEESEMEERIRDWKERVNMTSEGLSRRWCEGWEDVHWMRERYRFFGNLSYENVTDRPRLCFKYKLNA